MGDLYGGIGGGLQRKAAEEQVGKALGKTKSYISSIKKRIAENLPWGYETDLIKNIRSSARFNTEPYAIFAQGIRKDINQPKGKAFDKQISLYERRMQAATTFDEKKKIAEEYNRKAKKLAADANKNLKKGELPIRTLEMSFEKPSRVIKNQEAYKKYGDLFNEIHRKHGYSFKVPSDIKTLDQAKAYGRTTAGHAKMAKAAELGSPRLYSFPGMFENPGFLMKETIEGGKLAAKGLGKVAGAALGPTGITALNVALGVDPSSGLERAGLGAEAAFAPSLVKGTEYATKGLQNPAVRKAIQRALNMGMSLPMALRVAKMISPIGWAALGAEGVYQGGKFMYDDYQRRKEFLTPERKRKAQREYFNKDEPMFTEGGIASLKK
jgi:hypothetical protein